MTSVGAANPHEPSTVAAPEEPSPRSRAPFPRTVAIILAVGLVAALCAFTYLLGTQSASGGTPVTESGSVIDYVNLTVQIIASSGAPQYVPANFSVRAGLVAITIADEDDVVSWSSCTCNVTGTVGGVEWLNGTAYHVMPNTNIAHTFTIGSLGLNVLSPGGQTVFFEAKFPAGTYTWSCMAPCGSNGYGGFPMGTPGYMTGTITAV